MEQHSVCKRCFSSILPDRCLFLFLATSAARLMAEQPRLSFPPIITMMFLKCFIVVLILPAKSRYCSVSRFLRAIRRRRHPASRLDRSREPTLICARVVSRTNTSPLLSCLSDNSFQGIANNLSLNQV